MPWKKTSPTATKTYSDGHKATEVPQRKTFRIKNGSPQQEALWEEMKNGERNITMKALAGTGKTSSSVEGLHRMGNSGRTAMVAYNKPIADEMQEKVPQWVEASTMHAMGSALTKRAFRSKFDKFKLGDILTDIIGGDPKADLDWSQIELRKVCDSLVSLAKNTLVEYEKGLGVEGHLTPTAEGLAGIIDHFGIEIPARVSEAEAFDVTRQAMLRCFEDTEVIDFDDMIWLPVVHNLSGEKYRTLIVDEAQDLNRCRQELCLKVSERMIIVGDEHQAIYGFTGSDTESMNTMGRALERRENGHVVLPLTVTRRCPKLHVEMAKKIVPEFEAMPDAIEGTFGDMEFKDLLTQALPGDLMICRMNAPVCQAAFKLLSLGKKARIQGRDIGQGIIAVIRKSKKDTTKELLEWLADWRDKEEDRLRKRKRGFENAVQTLNDRYDCILAFAGRSTTTAEMIKVIDQTFSEGDNKDAIVLSSVHRAKGLEADRVVVLCPELLPAPWAKKDWEKVQEWNLRYVALTRSKRDMFFVPDWRRRQEVDTRDESVIQ